MIFSEVPSDILPLIVSLIARIIFSVQQWIEKEKIHPIAIFCDEAHLYIPQDVNPGIESLSLMSFERIAKIKSKETKGKWVKFKIEIYLHEQIISEITLTTSRVLQLERLLFIKGLIKCCTYR